MKIKNRMEIDMAGTLELIKKGPQDQINKIPGTQFLQKVPKTVQIRTYILFF